MLKVGLYGAEFFARHGFYEHEQITGNRFVVDIEVEYHNPNDLMADELSNTVNYEQLYAIAEDEMKSTKKLLETVAQGVVNQVKNQYPFIERLTVSIKKLNP